MPAGQKSKRAQVREKKRSVVEQQAALFMEPTEYAKNRPRRDMPGPRTALGHTR